jgi:NADH dehydrogenase
MKRQRIVVLGGTGFVGGHLVPRLCADGHTVKVLSRNREQHRDLAVLPRASVVSADVYDRDALREQLAGADAAINLIGILNERGSNGAGFQKAHVELTETLIAACQSAGVPRLLQMSALRAGEGESHYLKTRGEAESRVKSSSLAWTIFRPSVIFGPRDGLFFRFASLLRMTPVLPLARAHAKFTPVYVGDVAEAFARAIAHPHSSAHTYELFGPRVIELGELVRWTAEIIGKRRWIVPLPDALGFVQAAVGEWLPGKPISRDNFRSLKLDSVGTEDGLAALGIVSTPMDVVMPPLLRGEDRQRRFDRFREER